MPRLIINAPYGSNFKTILDFFISRLGGKKLAFVERLYFGSRGHALEGVAVFWRFKQNKNADEMFAATKKKERKIK